MTMSGMSDPGNAGAPGLPKKTLRPWEIAAKLLPTANGPIEIEQASDDDFQAWVVANGLPHLIDENGIEEWSFDDRCRIINFAIRRGMPLQFATQTIPDPAGNNSSLRIVSELFVLPKPLPEVDGDNPPDNIA
jgi:hypothetical protein